MITERLPKSKFAPKLADLYARLEREKEGLRRPGIKAAARIAHEHEIARLAKFIVARRSP